MRLVVSVNTPWFVQHWSSRMKEIGAYEAKTHLPSLLERVDQGETRSSLRGMAVQLPSSVRSPNATFRRVRSAVVAIARDCASVSTRRAPLRDAFPSLNRPLWPTCRKSATSRAHTRSTFTMRAISISRSHGRVPSPRSTDNCVLPPRAPALPRCLRTCAIVRLTRAGVASRRRDPRSDPADPRARSQAATRARPDSTSSPCARVRARSE